MGVYIPNMSKPTTCYMCKIADACKFKPKVEWERWQKVADDCPLIEIDLVRCGECKYMRKYALRSDEPTGIWCHRWSVPRLITDADFCSYGERRSDET